MKKNDLEFFELAKMLNEKYSEKLLQMEAHFRGNINSCSLISLNKNTPERGVDIKKENAERKLLEFNPKEPIRSTPEKSLQAWIILNAIQNNYLLPFGENLTFITSELAIKEEEGEFEIPEGEERKKIVNDILAIDENNTLVVIELKSSRVNEVKKQAIKFKRVIELNKPFFEKLTKLMTNKTWNGKIRCLIVWPKSGNKTRKEIEEYKQIEEYQYSNSYNFEKKSE